MDTQSKMLTAAACARRLDIPGERFRRFVRQGLIKADRIADCGVGRVHLFDPSRLDEMKKVIDAAKAETVSA